LGTVHRRAQEGVIERRVVCHDHGTLAAVLAYGPAHRAEHVRQGLVLVDRKAERVPRIDAREGECLRVQACIRERLHVVEDHRAGHDLAALVHVDDARADLEQGIGLCLETAGLDIDDDGQEAAESPCERAVARVAFLLLLVTHTHGLSPMGAQP
jgi:hypothetical protein